MSSDGIVSGTADRKKFQEITGKTPEEFKAELAQAEPSEREKELEAKLIGVEADEKKDITGEDIDFDLEKFITEGVVFRKNIRLVEGVYVDMQTLTQRQQVLADRMVRSYLGSNPPRDLPYFDVMEAAVLAVAVTRMNNQHFPIPGKTNSEEDRLAAERKTYLFEKFLDAPVAMIQALSFIYGNLPLRQALSEDGTKKS